MNKASRLIKRYVALILLLLFSIESFAAVVGDNDGAAFITKAEFDSLKNDFQSQLDTYNSSIDNKIDGAIASYLSGVTVAKKTLVKPLVASFSDLYWCHDFDLVAIKKTWTAKNTSSESAYAPLIPDYTNREGWVYWMQDRGVRTAYHEQNLWGSFICPIRFTFASDNSGATRTSHRQAQENGMSMTTLNVSDDRVINLTTPLIQFQRIFYLWGRFTDRSSGSTGVASVADRMKTSDPTTDTTRSDQYIKIEPVTNYKDDYVTLRIHVGWMNGGTKIEHWDRVSWNSDNTEAFPVCWTDYNTSGAVYENSDYATFPMYTYRAPSLAQANADKRRIVNMMIGANTTFEMPMVFNLQNGGRTGAVASKMDDIGYDSVGGATDSLLGYEFPSYKLWNKKNIVTELDFPEKVTVIWKSTSTTTAGGWSTITWPTALYDTAMTTVNISCPVTTLFKINTVKSPTAIYQNKNLNITGGIPLLDESQEKGQLQVKIKCEKKYDDVASSKDPTNCNAHIKFKKTDFTNTKSDYCTGTYTGQTTTVTFDDNLTIDIKEKTFLVDVNKGDSVWLNIDPITLGQHIRITSMEVTMITE